MKVDKRFPASELCQSCGCIHKTELSERTYVCNECGHIIDRDYQGAMNIRDEGLSNTERKAHCMDKCSKTDRTASARIQACGDYIRWICFYIDATISEAGIQAIQLLGGSNLVN